jgi:hypothetical protein
MPSIFLAYRRADSPDTVKANAPSSSGPTTAA